MRSIPFIDKLNSRFQDDPIVVETMDLLAISKSPNRFNSPSDLQNHLVEGALLNISVIGSKALSVPCGEYLVWMTDAGHTMLVPTTAPKNREVFENSQEQYEVTTKKLMANWNKIERILAESTDKPDNLKSGNNEDNLEDNQEDNKIKSEIDMSTVDRPSIASAIKDQGYTVTSLAAAVGVDAPAISRIMRVPSQGHGDPGGRNPSIGLASEICRILRLDPTTAFPDLFNPQQKHKPRKQAGNRGSGSHSHGKGGGKWDQGNSNKD